jgi:hypothetical protein
MINLCNVDAAGFLRYKFNLWPYYPSKKEKEGRLI